MVFMVSWDTWVLSAIMATELYALTNAVKMLRILVSNLMIDIREQSNIEGSVFCQNRPEQNRLSFCLDAA